MCADSSTLPAPHRRGIALPGHKEDCFATAKFSDDGTTISDKSAKPTWQSQGSNVQSRKAEQEVRRRRPTSSSWRTQDALCPFQSIGYTGREFRRVHLQGGCCTAQRSEYHTRPGSNPRTRLRLLRASEGLSTCRMTNAFSLPAKAPPNSTNGRGMGMFRSI